MSKRVRILVSRDTIERYIEEEGLGPINYRKGAQEIEINSLWAPDAKHHLGISYSDSRGGLWNDYKSGFGGDFLRFVELHKQINASEALFLLVKRYGVSINSVLSAASGRQIVESDIGNLALADTCSLPIDSEPIIWGSEDHGVPVGYLEARGITEEQSVACGLRWWPETKRIVFPTRDPDGTLATWSARDVTGETSLRWLTESHEDDRHPVFLADRIVTGGTVWVFEGQFDAFAVWPGGVSMHSARCSEQQLQKILSAGPSRIVVVMDNDRAGRYAAHKICAMLLGREVDLWRYDWRNSSYKDASEAGKNFDQSSRFRFTSQTGLKMRLDQMASAAGQVERKERKKAWLKKKKPTSKQAYHRVMSENQINRCTRRRT